MNFWQGQFNNIEIGRVYVDDLDDWDLDDKIFQWEEDNPYFALDTDTGKLTMLEGIAEGDYTLKFLVTEEGSLIPRHQVDATVVVTVKEIPEEAVIKSGSIRLNETSIEDFITKQDSFSKKDILQLRLAKILNTSKDNVDVFTVLVSPSDENQVDVRFSAHGSPYYSAEKLNSIASQHRVEVILLLLLFFFVINNLKTNLLIFSLKIILTLNLQW